MQITTEKIPTYALCYFIYNDASGMDEQDIVNAENWLKESGIKEVLTPDEENQPYFTHSPAFGLPCEVIECPCVLSWN